MIKSKVKYSHVFRNNRKANLKTLLRTLHNIQKNFKNGRYSRYNRFEDDLKRDLVINYNDAIEINKCSINMLYSIEVELAYAQNDNLKAVRLEFFEKEELFGNKLKRDLLKFLNVNNEDVYIL